MNTMMGYSEALASIEKCCQDEGCSRCAGQGFYARRTGLPTGSNYFWDSTEGPLTVEGLLPLDVLKRNNFTEDTAQIAVVNEDLNCVYNVRAHAITVFTSETVGLVNGEIGLVGTTELVVDSSERSYIGDIESEIRHLAHIAKVAGASISGTVNWRDEDDDCNHRITVRNNEVFHDHEIRFYPNILVELLQLNETQVDALRAIPGVKLA